MAKTRDDLDTMLTKAQQFMKEKAKNEKFAFVSPSARHSGLKSENSHDYIVLCSEEGKETARFKIMPNGNLLFQRK